MSLEGLAPPGSSSYTSSTMHVGDGTWDRKTDTFLLPNLQGLNFATMRYNGMANRFKDVPQYHTYILGHGVLAAITFIFLLPLAIFLAKYGHDWPGGRVSFKLHVYIQIIIVFLSTVVLVLGWFAVGPQRSLTNPHHGIGVAIYVLILFQFLYGSCWFRRERRRKNPPLKLPLTVWLHRLLGRATALLAFIEIALGLTLYGSPKVLFILYSLVGAFLLFCYLALDYYYMPRTDGTRPGGHNQSEFYSDYGSQISGSRTGRRGPHWGRDLLVGTGLVGAYEWMKYGSKKKRQQRDQRYDDESVVSRPQQPSTGPPAAVQWGHPQGGPPQSGPPPMGGPPPVMAGARSRRPMAQSSISGDSYEDEKYDDRRARPRWGTRMLEATGAFAAYEGARDLFSRRRRRDDEYESSYGGSALDANRPAVSQADVSRVAAGQAPESPGTPRVNLGGAQPMTPTMTPSRPPRGERTGDAALDVEDGQAQPRPLLDDRAPLSEHVRELGPIAGLREWNRMRRNRKQNQRAEDERRQELEDQFNRNSSDRYPRPEDAMQRRASLSGTHMTGPSAQDNGASPMGRTNAGPDTLHPPLPAEAGMLGTSSQAPFSRQNVSNQQGYQLPPPPPGPPPANGYRSDGYGSRHDFGSAQMPEGAVNPDPRRLLSDNTAANESSAYGRDPPIRDDIAGAAAGGALGAAAVGAAMDSRRGPSQSPSRGQDSRSRLPRSSRRGSAASASNSNAGAAGPSRPSNPNSPPVSVKVKMHNDGRHVTLRRLNDEEAAAEREARRQDRRRQRASSLSSGADEGPSTGQRYRRNGGVRASSDQPITNVPPPPPMSSSAGASFRRESELSPPPAVPAAQQHSSPPSNQTLSSPAPPMNESGMGYITDQGTDISAFENNRRRRRAERARRAEAAKAGGGSGGKGVEFE